MRDFLTYTRFYNIEDAESLIEILKRENIPYEIEHEVNQLDSVYIGGGIDAMIAVRIPQELFPKLNAIFGETAEKSIGTNSDYYLYSFSNNELIAVINHPEEWNSFDRTLAAKILGERKVELPTPHPPQQYSYKPERLKKEWIFIGYLVSTCAIAGILMGLSISNGKKTLSNGQRVPIYDQQSIWHGKNMIKIGIISTIYLVYRIFRDQ